MVVGYGKGRIEKRFILTYCLFLTKIKLYTHLPFLFSFLDAVAFFLPLLAAVLKSAHQDL